MAGGAVKWRILGATTLAVALTRWLALSRTLWDSDEALFVAALRHFDVAAHHPQPPGLPFFVGAAKLLTLAGVDGFHALQTLDFVAAIAIVPAMFFFAEALGADFVTSISAAVILAFTPNVWLYGGTALSDVPSMVLSLAAAALLLRGRAMPGAIVAGITIGIRPHTLLLFVVVWLLARTRVAAIALTLAIAAAGYAAAAQLTGWSAFLHAVREHQAYLAQFDAWTSPTRPPLTHLVDDFFIRPYRAQLINILTSLLALVAVIRHSRVTLRALAIFAPLCLVTWLTLDRFSASRFAVAYAPLFALLAAEALAGLRARVAVAGAYVALMIVWTFPALRVVHTTISPPLLAANWLHKNVHERVWVSAAMAPFLDGPEAGSAFVWCAHPGEWLLAEGKGAITFRRRHGHLWRLARQRYFDASVTPVQPLVDFGGGWYGEEQVGEDRWRWMARRSTTRFRTTGTTLTIDFFAPDPRQSVALFVDGKPLDRFVAGQVTFPRTYRVRNPRELAVETDRVTHNGSDPRALGLRLADLRLTD
jgi:hypothetical protein